MTQRWLVKPLMVGLNMGKWAGDICQNLPTSGHTPLLGLAAYTGSINGRARVNNGGRVGAWARGGGDPYLVTNAVRGGINPG